MVTGRGIPVPALADRSSLRRETDFLGHELLWRAVFEGVDHGLLVLSEPHQVIVEANRAVCDAWQVERAELIGQRLDQVVEKTARGLSGKGRLQCGPAAGQLLEWRLHTVEEAALGLSIAMFSGGSESARPTSEHGDDAITRIPSRQFLEEELERRLERKRRSSRPFALLFLDLDGFKQVNDQHGHLVGDDILREVAGRLAEAVRDGDVVARYGGDEFVVLADGIATMRDAGRLARRIAAAIEQPIALAAAKSRGAIELRLGASIGLAIAAEPSIGPRDLLEKADRDMYRRKRQRRRRIG